MAEQAGFSTSSSASNKEHKDRLHCMTSSVSARTIHVFLLRVCPVWIIMIFIDYLHVTLHMRFELWTVCSLIRTHFHGKLDLIPNAPFARMINNQSLYSLCLLHIFSLTSCVVAFLCARVG